MDLKKIVKEFNEGFFGVGRIGVIAEIILIAVLFILAGSFEEVSAATITISNAAITVSGIIIGFCFLVLSPFFSKRKIVSSENQLLEYTITVLERFLLVIAIAFVNLVVSNFSNTFKTVKGISLFISLCMLFVSIFVAFGGIYSLIDYTRSDYFKVSKNNPGASKNIVGMKTKK